MLIYLKASVARLRFRLRSTQLFFFKKFTRCANFFCAKRNLRLSRSLQSHFARCRAKKKSLSESNHVTQRYGNYRGGCPVPRATSLYNGGKQIYAITLVYVGFSPLISPINPFQTAKSQGLDSDHHPNG